MSTETKEMELFTPGTNKMMESVSAFCTKMGLPVEAATSVMRAAQAYRNLKKTVEKQRKLPDEERKALIKAKAVSPVGLKMVDDLVEAIGVPYNTISIIEGRPYVGAEGLRMLIQSDPRIIKSINTSKIRGEWHDNNYIAEFKARIDFWGGGSFEAIGAADLNELQSRRERTAAPPSFVDMIAETRAERRASRRAVSLPVGVTEDIEESEEGKITIQVVPVQQEEQRIPKNKAQLLAYAMSAYDMRKSDVEKIVNLAEVKDYGEAWKQIQDAKKKEAESKLAEESAGQSQDATATETERESEELDKEYKKG